MTVLGVIRGTNMIVYEVTATVRQELRAEFESYMRTAHVRDLLDTGHFKGAEMAISDGGVYKIRYWAEDREALEDYFGSEGERLREDFLNHFPDGIEISREVLKLIDSWNWR